MGTSKIIITPNEWTLVSSTAIIYQVFGHLGLYAVESQSIPTDISIKKRIIPGQFCSFQPVNGNLYLYNPNSSDVEVGFDSGVISNGFSTYPSIVPGSSVVTNKTVELIKKGYMYVLNDVFQGISVGSTKRILFDHTLIDADFYIIYEFAFKVSQGKAIGTFYEKGDYSGGTPIQAFKKNENSPNNYKVSASIDPTGTTLGSRGLSYLAGSETQGVSQGGGFTAEKDFPTEIDTSVDRVFEVVQSGGNGTFDLEIRAVFAELYI